MAKRFFQSEHDSMVANVAAQLRQIGRTNIRADLSGFPQPEKIIWSSTGSGHIPDVTSWSGQLEIFEIETADSISDSHTQDQWRLFDAYAKQHGARFTVVIPKGNGYKARQQAAVIGVAPQIVEI